MELKLDEIPDDELVKLVKRNVRIDEFDLPLDQISSASVNIKRLRHELEQLFKLHSRVFVLKKGK